MKKSVTILRPDNQPGPNRFLETGTQLFLCLLANSSQHYKLRRVAEFLAREHRRVSDHMNFQMAALSLSGCVRQIEEVLAAVGTEAAAAPDPLDEGDS